MSLLGKVNSQKPAYTFFLTPSGQPDAPIAVTGTADLPNGNRRRGTEITFFPSSKIFAKTEFDFATIERRLRGLASLNVGATVVLSDRRGIEGKEVVLDL